MGRAGRLDKKRYLVRGKNRQCSRPFSPPRRQERNPYGLIPALREGGLISQTVFGILVLMLFFSLYILFTKLFEQQKILNRGQARPRRLPGTPTACAKALRSSRRTRPIASWSTTA